MKIYEGNVTGKNLKFAIVVARFNDRDGDNATFSRENLRHAEFNSQKCFCQCCHLLRP